MTLRIAFALVALGACRDRSAREPPRRSTVETEIARDLTARFAAAITARCSFVAGMPFDCKAVLADGGTLPIAIKKAGRGWDWRIDGLVIETPPLAAHIKGMLTDLGLDQTVSCGAAIVRVQPGERMVCPLSGGGAAFVDIARNGATSFELAVDRSAAQSRGEPLVPEHERVMTQTSRALEHLAGEETEEEGSEKEGSGKIDEPEIDGGVQKP